MSRIKRVSKQNLEIIKEIVEQSEFPILTQAFIIEAMSHYAKLVRRSSSSSFKHLFITADLWKSIAKEVEDGLDKYFVDGEKVSENK